MSMKVYWHEYLPERQTYALHFAWWVRLIARFQKRGNDGLRRIEQWAMAYSYRHHQGKPPTPREQRELRARLEANR